MQKKKLYKLRDLIAKYKIIIGVYSWEQGPIIEIPKGRMIAIKAN